MRQDGINKFVLAGLGHSSDVKKIIPFIANAAKPFLVSTEKELFLHILEVLEALLSEGWIKGSVVESYGFITPPEA